MFGRGRFNAGVIVDPKPEYAFDPSDENALAEFRKAIWYISSSSLQRLINLICFRNTVEELNNYAPQHSRIFKEVADSL